MEVELVLEGLPENLLKLVSVEGSPDTLPNLSKFLKLGALLQATVLESLPEKNKAIIKISNKRIIVETRQALTPGHSFSAQVHKSSPGSPLQIKIIASPPEVHFQSPKESNPSTLSFWLNLYDQSISKPLCKAFMGTTSEYLIPAIFAKILAGLFSQTVK